MSNAPDWEIDYLNTPVEKLPWNAGGPNPDLVKWVQSGRIPPGQALDLGTGPGHDAVYLIQQGFNVIAIDISPSAVKIARENASTHGLFGFFQQGDIRNIPVEDKFVDFAYDRGCFHVLAAEDRPKAVNEIARVLRRGGLFMLFVFSDKETWKEGPHCFSRKELEDLFLAKFKFLEFWEGEFKGPATPKTVSYYSMLMERK
jgi:ubiquinone/menaquinone biosynthesis C-methylase UbiE